MAKPIQRKSIDEGKDQTDQPEIIGSIPDVTPSVYETVQSKGHSLPEETRSFMEERFGYDFSKVQIHNDSMAHQSSSEIDANAYTHGHHIVFGAGQYQPATDLGKHLIAHELSHVIQQGTPANKTTGKTFIQKEDKTKPQPAAPPPKKTPCPEFISLEGKASEIGMKDYNGKCQILFGVPGKSPGMKFTAKVKIPKDCAGKLQFLQLTKFCRYSESSKKKVVSIKTDGYWLDFKDPYDEKSYDSPKEDDYSTDDSPGQPEGGIFMKVDDHFTMWLLWQPADGKDRIALASIDWSWNATAKANDLTKEKCEDKWTLVSKDHSVGKGKKTSTLPTWKKVNPKDMKLGADKC
jgi:hypothetical protein